MLTRGYLLYVWETSEKDCLVVKYNPWVKRIIQNFLCPRHSKNGGGALYNKLILMYETALANPVAYLKQKCKWF